MAALKGLMAGAAGAAAFQAYRDGDGLFSTKDIASGLYDAFQKSGKVGVGEMSRLQRQVEDLQGALLKTLHDRQQGPIIIQSGSGRGSSTAVGVVVVVGTVAVYLRYVKGYRLSDLMYVTRSSLTNLKQSVQDGLAVMQEQVRATTDELRERLGMVGAKADDLLVAQAEMDDTLRRVEGNVVTVGDQLVVLQDQVQYSNQAITLLCGSVAEVAKRCGINNGRYTRALEGLSRAAPGLQGPPGFQGLPGPSANGRALEAAPGPQAAGLQAASDYAPSSAGAGLQLAQGGGSAGLAAAPNPAIFTLPSPGPRSPPGAGPALGAGAGAGAYERGRAATSPGESLPPSFGEYLKQGRSVRSNSDAVDAGSGSSWFGRR